MASRIWTLETVTFWLVTSTMSTTSPAVRPLERDADDLLVGAGQVLSGDLGGVDQLSLGDLHSSGPTDDLIDVGHRNESGHVRGDPDGGQVVLGDDLTGLHGVGRCEHLDSMIHPGGEQAGEEGASDDEQNGQGRQQGTPFAWSGRQSCRVRSLGGGGTGGALCVALRVFGMTQWH